MDTTPTPPPPAPPPADVLDLMREIGHGRVEHLRVAAGAPLVTAHTKLLRRFRPGRADPPPTPPDTRGTTRGRHRQHAKLLAECQRVGDGVIDRVEVADGLPVFWSPAQPAAPRTA